MRTPADPVALAATLVAREWPGERFEQRMSHWRDIHQPKAREMLPFGVPVNLPPTSVAWARHRPTNDRGDAAGRTWEAVRPPDMPTPGPGPGPASGRGNATWRLRGPEPRGYRSFTAAVERATGTVRPECLDIWLGLRLSRQLGERG